MKTIQYVKKSFGSTSMTLVKRSATRVVHCAAVLMFALSAPVNAMEFGAFADVKFVSSTDDAQTAGFMLGQFDLFASHEIGEKTRAFVEYVFEGDGNTIVTDVERLSVQRIINDRLSIAAGRFHTPIGYWNNVYHHGALLQDTTGRPSFLDFEDGDGAILPTHIVGLMASGKIASGKMSWGYDVAVGNGGSINTDAGVERELEMNNVGDPNDSKAIAARVSVDPENSGAKFGFSFVNGEIAESGVASAEGVAQGNTLVAQKIYGIDVRYESDKFDVLAEVYQFANDNKTGSKKKHTATAWFAQLGYQSTDAVKLTYRYETTAFDDDDEYFAILGRMEHDHHVVALRYDLDESNALRFEVNRAMPAIGDDETSMTVQWAFVIP